MNKTVKPLLDSLLQELTQVGLDIEESCNILRRFRKQQWSLLEEENDEVLFRHLTEIAEITLEAAVVKARKDLEAMQLAPSSRLAVVAMGKFGGWELNYGSDLDIIFLFENPGEQERFVRLGQKIISLMTIITREGYAYKIDTELRPSGRSGMLVSSFASFQEYHKTMAQLWEQQALLKARPIIGEESFLHEVHEFIGSVAYQKRQPAIAREINRLRRRMEKELAREGKGRMDIKVGRGGLVDIEFMVQYLQLLHGWDHPALQTTQTIKALEGTGEFLSPDEVQKAREAYFFYRKLETHLRRMTGQHTSLVMEASPMMIELEEKFFPELNGKLMDILHKTRNHVRGLYERIVHD